MNHEINNDNTPTHSDLHGQVCTEEKVTHVLMTDGRLFRRVIAPPRPRARSIRVSITKQHLVKFFSPRE